MMARRLMVTGLLAVGVAAPLFAGDRPESLSEWAQRQQSVGGDAGRITVNESSLPQVSKKPNPAPLALRPAANDSESMPVNEAPSTSHRPLRTEDISSITAPKSGEKASVSMFASSNASGSWSSSAVIAPDQPSDARVVVPASAANDDHSHAYGSHGGHVSVGVGVGIGIGVGVGVGVGYHSHEYRHSDYVYVGTGCYGGYYRPAYCETVVYSQPAYYPAPVYYTPAVYQPVYYSEPVYYSQPVVYYRPAYYYAPAPCVAYRTVTYCPPPSIGLSIGVHGRF